MLNVKIEEKSYKNRLILKNIDCSFNDKGLYVIRGFNGSGKTTLLRIISFLDKDFIGCVEYESIDSTMSTDKKDNFRKNNIFYCKPNNNLISFLNVEENIKLESNNISLELLGDIPLKAYVNELSGGQQMLVALSKMINTTKKYIYLDEVTSQLDDINTAKLYDVLKRLSKTKLIILATHDTRILNLADVKIIELREGELYDTNQ